MYINASAPDAPPFSDTTIGCFIRLFFWIAACIIRAIWSEAPPAPAATTISTGFVGSHAAAGAVRANVDARAHKLNRIRASAMVLSSLLSLPWGRVVSRNRCYLLLAGTINPTFRRGHLNWNFTASGNSLLTLAAPSGLPFARCTAADPGEFDARYCDFHACVDDAAGKPRVRSADRVDHDCRRAELCAAVERDGREPHG